MGWIAETVRNSARQIDDLGASVEQISSIVNVISAIAEQTNLLALNAAIERRAPVTRAAVSPWWPTRYACWPSARGSRPRRSAA